jgi:HEPN domain-containing protein
MNIKEVIDYWLTSAEDDIRVAQHLYEAGDYPQALFFGHLYLEKILKALVVQETGTHAPYSHNLTQLAKKAGIAVDTELRDKLADITDFNIDCRYPDEKFEFKQRCTQPYCKNWLAQIKGLGKCFRKKIRL